MSGVEFAGLALAVLPLVVNQLDNYARGIETIKDLRRYRWELERYSSTLSAQHAIFLNTLEIFLQDVVDDYDDQCELISNPQGNAWKDPRLRTAMMEKLGRNYNAFTGIVSGLCSLLEELSNRLDRYTPDHLKAVSIKSLGKIKFRKILSKAVYEDILDRIDKANQILKTISDQSQQLDQTRKVSHRWRKGLKSHRDRRRHARALYNILVQGQGWKCPCRDNHTVGFPLDANTMHDLRNADRAKKSRFLMMLSAANKIHTTNTAHNWHEVELLPEIIELHLPLRFKEPSISVSEGKRKVQFASSSTILCTEPMYKSPNDAGPIDDLCSTLSSCKAANTRLQQDAIGYILNQSSDTRYNLRLLRSIDQGINLSSLQDALDGSNLGSSAQCSDELSRRDRLYLAAVLACAVLQLHGSWLKQQWGTKDILFAQGTSQSTGFEQPYLVWQVPGSSTCQNSTPPSSNKIHDEILLPLGVTLIELSLGKTISALYRVEDLGPSESQTHFNTATRALRNVYCESGSNYGDVVKDCLYWSRNNGERFEDQQFDESVFDMVVSPLLKDFDYFEGISRMR